MNDQDLADLEAGHVIMSEKTDFPYKVTIRQGYRNTQDRQALGNYLKSIRSEIKISDFLLQGMIHQNKYLHSCYFYVNDKKIVSISVNMSFIYLILTENSMYVNHIFLIITVFMGVFL